jgi:uncharacterized protein YgiM (DUF1202 family)
MTQRLIGLAVACCLLAMPALAVSKGGKLYIKSKDTKVLDKADAKGKVVGTLQPGEEVTWNGADDKNKQFHAIDTGKVKGFTLQGNLSPSKPQAELLARDNGAPIDGKAFASSGAATKALNEAALKAAGKKQTKAELVKGLATAEGVAASVTVETKGGAK